MKKLSKLKLNKKTISSLNDHEMSMVKGGSNYCPSNYVTCPGNTTCGAMASCVNTCHHENTCLDYQTCNGANTCLCGGGGGQETDYGWTCSPGCESGGGESGINCDDTTFASGVMDFCCS
jgi:natural product precursor